MNRKHLPASLLMMSMLLFLMSAAAEAKEPVMAPRIEAPTLNGDMQMVPEKGKRPFCIFGQHGARPAKWSCPNLNRL